MQASPHLMLSRSVRVEIGVIRSINRRYACTGRASIARWCADTLVWGVHGTAPSARWCWPTARCLARCRRYVGLADALVSAAAASGPVEGCGYPDQVGERLDLHLPHNPAAMGLHRDLADSELCRNLFVRPAGDHQSHDLPFARS